MGLYTQFTLLCVMYIQIGQLVIELFSFLSNSAYDGGIGQRPGVEGHGGHTYCALASLALMGRQDALSKPQKLKVLRWCVFRLHQGFQVNQIFIYINSKNMRFYICRFYFSIIPAKQAIITAEQKKPFRTIFCTKQSTY